MFRTSVLIAVVLCAGTVFAQTPGERPPPSDGPRVPRGAAIGLAPLKLESLPAIVELDIVLAQWADGTEGERRTISETLAGDAKEVADRFVQLQAEGKFAAVESIRVSTLDGRVATVRTGQSRPFVTNVQRTQFGVSNGVSLRDVGTVAEFAPQVFEKENVLLQIRLEKSDQQSGDDLPALMETNDGKKVPSAMTTRFSFETTLRLSSGRTIVAAGTSSKSDRHLLLITAKVTP